MYRKLICKMRINTHTYSFASSHLDAFGDPQRIRNENGSKLLKLCYQYDLFITTTLFTHKESRIYTWYKWSDMICRSQTEFILARNDKKRPAIDAIAIPNLSSSNDHKSSSTG